MGVNDDARRKGGSVKRRRWNPAEIHGILPIVKNSLTAMLYSGEMHRRISNNENQKVVPCKSR